MSGREAPLYLDLWSLPNWEALSTADSEWTWLEGLPVYRLAVEGAGGRAWQLLEAVVAPVREILLQARPEALLLGTARGEVGLLLESFARWREKKEGPSPLLSPETSGGTLASRLARSLEISGPAWVVSQTCLSGLLALYQAALFVRSAEAQTVLFGAVEASLHPFLVRMMAALRLYTPRKHYPYVKPGGGEGNTFALGEGVALGLLSQKPISPFQLLAVRVVTAPPKKGLAFTAVDATALEALLRRMGTAPPDMIFLHAPGTQQGDTAEWQAVQKVWGPLPALSVKAFFGHSLGAAPLVSLGLLLEVLRRQSWPTLPYTPIWGNLQPRQWQEAVLIGLGYGGTMGAIRIRYVAGSPTQS